MAEQTLAELETIFSMTGDNHKEFEVFSDDPYWQRRLEKVGAELLRTTKDGGGKFYRLPANQLTVRKPVNLSEEQREARRANARRHLGKAQDV